jgi:hypothetical protein
MGTRWARVVTTDHYSPGQEAGRRSRVTDPLPDKNAHPMRQKRILCLQLGASEESRQPLVSLGPSCLPRCGPLCFVSFPGFV